MNFTRNHLQRDVESRERHYLEELERKGKMPYVKQEDREKLDHWIDNVLFHTSGISEVSKDGVINYIITRIIDGHYGKGGYAVFNRAMGVLDCVAREFYRRRVAPYEDKKIQENGDVY